MYEWWSYDGIWLINWLTSAIIAVIQVLRVNPDKYNIIFDNGEYDNRSEYDEALLEIASSFLKILLRQMVDKTIVAAAVVGEEWTTILTQVEPIQ